MRLAAAAGLLAVSPAPPPAAAQDAAQLMLRGGASALSKSPPHGWRAARHMEGLRLGDSVYVGAGYGEIVFRSGARVLVARGERTSVAEPAADRGRGAPSLGAAVTALFRLLMGSPAAPSSDIAMALEAPVSSDGRTRRGALESFMLERSGGRTRRLQLPAGLHPWTVLPERPAIWWDLFPDPFAAPVLVRIYPALISEGCPPSGHALLASTFESPAALQSALAGRLQPGGRYRVELGFGDGFEAGCIQVAPLQEQDALRAQLAALGEEYAAGVPLETDDYGVTLLEAALLADQGYGADALLRLAPLVTGSSVPPPVLDLWLAITERAMLAYPDR